MKSKTILFGIDSYFQLMLAINLRTTLYKDDIADIIICSQYSPNFYMSEKLKVKFFLKFLT